ncbi:effector-associated constant component EACC1 [Nocardia sp. NBC_00403]|uniref:effector-associated constant component EACC1 n=1 Tax=Nocardia sp. NBC_00403 TaxID=2975990 RepID=UPI002E230DD0
MNGGDAAHVLTARIVMALAADSDTDQVDRLARQLRAELSELDVDSVALVRDGLVPYAAKSADPVTIGALVVALSASGGVFTALIETLRDWLNRQAATRKISVTIDGDTIELERATADQRGALIEAFLVRHTAEGRRSPA